MIDITAIVRFFPSYEELMKYMVGDNLIIYLISVVILAPIIEELCLRGIIFNRLESWMRTWLAVLIQAALFGIAHMNLFQGLYAFIDGVALGWLYIRFRKLWLCIIGHMGFNFVSFIIILLERKGVEISNWTLIPIAVVFIVGIYFLFKIPAAKEKYTPSADGDIFAEEG